MLKIPIQDLMDFEKCYAFLLELLHPTGLHCRCGIKLPSSQCPHKYRSNGLACYKCRSCKKVYNIFSDTIFQGTHYNCIIIFLLLLGRLVKRHIRLTPHQIGKCFHDGDTIFPSRGDITFNHSKCLCPFS